MRPTSAPLLTLTSGFLLIEPSNLDTETFAEPLPMQRCTPAGWSNADALMPRLIDIAALSATQQEIAGLALLGEAHANHPPAVCARLSSRLTVAELARHIARFLVGPAPEGGPLYWRYHDPRVFAVAMTVLPPPQRAALLGPITEWQFVWQGNWWSASGPGCHNDPLAGSLPAWPTDMQWRSLDQCVSIDQVLRHLRGDQAPLAPALSLQHQQLASAALQEAAHRWKLYDAADQIDYAVLCLRFGTSFTQHRKLDTAWSELASGERSWPAFLALLTSADVERMESETPTTSGDNDGREKLQIL